MTNLTLHTTIFAGEHAAAILLTEEDVATLSADQKNPPVLVTIGDKNARLRVARMGGQIMIGLSKASQAQLGVKGGDQVEAIVAVDTAERMAEVPDQLATALDQAGLRARFDALAYSKRKEAARQVTDARADATRERRIAKILIELQR